MRTKRWGVALAALALAGGVQAAAQGACDRFVGKLPNVTRPLCEGAQLAESGALSVKGTPIYVRDVGADTG